MAEDRTSTRRDSQPRAAEACTESIDGSFDARRLDELVESHILDAASIAFCLTDPNQPDNPLVYVNRGFEQLTGYDAEECLGRNCRFLQGEETDSEAVSRLREAVAEERPVSVEILNYRMDGTAFWNEVEVVPIYEDGDLVYFLGSQRDVTDRKERERQLRQQSEQLEVLNQFNRIIRGVNSALVSASTREEIEDVVCERLAAAEWYDAAWVAKVDNSSAELTSRASAGLDEAFFEAETGSDPESIWTPTLEAAHEQTVQVVRDVERARNGPWRDWALERGFRGAVAVPLGFREFQYDVLTIYTSREGAFAGQERDAVDQLQEIVGHAINAIERREALLNNVVVRLEFVLQDVDDALTAAASSVGEPLSLERTVPAAGDETVLFVRIPENGSGDTEDRLARLPTVTHAHTVTRRETDSIFEIRVTEPPITASLASYGGQVIEARVEDDELHVAVELPGDVDVREVVSAVRSLYPDAELASQRSTTRSPQTIEEFQSALADRLTGKQQAAMEAAYAAGYFEWPRRSTGEEVAEMLDVSPATFHEHLRIGLRELLAASLDQSDDGAKAG